MKIAGAVGVVTGSGSAAGSGRATALALARAGARAVVINHSRVASEDKALAVALEVEAAGAEGLVVRADVASDEQCRELMGTVATKFGRLDILVNNAGVTVPVKFDDLDGLTDEVWDVNLAVNLKGTFYCARAARPYMEAGGDGVVVNVASIAGLGAISSSSMAYSASKAGVINLTKCLARTLAPRIRVNCVSPGFIDGQWMEARLGPERYDRAVQRVSERTPRGRIAQPDDVAQAVMSLIQSDYLTGINVVCDGGFHLQNGY